MNNDGGPAFPVDYQMDTFENRFKGMTMRDWFAGQALMGWISNNNMGGDEDDCAQWCYRYADAMLKEREK